MDKFTVDLDQVLNDFEYSELTDQYNITKASSEPPHTAISPSSHITKHSINNVFHSLNEYLNSNIKTSLEPVDNTIRDNVDAFSDSHPKTSDFKKSIDESKTDQNLYSFNEPLTRQNIQFENSDNVNSSTIKSSGTERKSTDKPDPVNVDSLLEQNKNILVDDKVFVDVSSRENTQSFIGIEGTSFDELANDTIRINDDVEVLKEIDLNIEINLKTNDIKEKEVVNGDRTDDIIHNTPLEPTGTNINESDSDYEDSDALKEFDKRDDQIVSLQDELLEADNEGREDTNTGKQEIGDVTIKSEINTLVGFQDDLNLEDHEIIKLLSELEEDDDLNVEMDESQVNAFSKNEDCEIDSGLSDQCNFEDATAVDKIKEEAGQELNSKNTSNDEEKTELLQPTVNIQEYVISNPNLEENLADNKERDLPVSNVLNLSVSDDQLDIDNSDIKKDESLVNESFETEYDKPQEIIEGPKIESDLTETILHKEYIQDDPDPILDELIKEDMKSKNIEDDMQQESLQRPQNLPLSNEIIEANRKINLIGSPGSTPYNNIYINNEIDKQETSDLDSSSSSSATFSDASSTASTASTEDIQDKADIANLEDTKLQILEQRQPNSISAETFNSATVVAAANPFERQDVSPNLEASAINNERTESEYPPSERQVGETQENAANIERSWLGKEAPLWIPDSEAMSCLHCDMRFTVLKRRHHCRACGLVLCSKCCHLRFRLEYLDAEARVCNKCHHILNRESSSSGSSSSSSDLSPEMGNSPSNHRPNPNNPAEYCSTVSPLQQAGQQIPVPSVMVPVGVLKRKGSNKSKTNKSVMFCDGIRPGSDLTHLDNDFNYNNTVTKKLEKNNISGVKLNRNLPIIDSETNTFIPKNENSLPPTVIVNKTDIKYAECSNNISTVNTLKIQQLSFAIHISLYVHVKIIDMNCCMKKMAWCFSTEGLINVGQDEIVFLLEYIEDECVVPKDVFYHINNIYNDAVKGNAIKELGLSLHNSSNFLDSKNHAGFVYVRPSFQCLENVVKPKDPYLVGLLIHRWETPWAKLFPLRLVLRLGAEYRYYPCPIISTRHRDSVYVEIGHTIINILADFRNFSYTLPQIRGLIIHMEDKNTTVSIPVNRYDQVIKSLNNSSDHILAFAGNFSIQADSHLVCIQDTQGNENCYSTQAINIQNKPRKITGASFIVFNGALKSSSGLTAKSNIIEDGLMIQVLPEHLEQIRDSLRAMKNHTIQCGCIDDVSDETVQIVWSENDTNFNMGIVSTIDNTSLSGVPSIRVHNGKNYICHNGSRIIRWTEVFIIQNGEENPKNQDPVDISRVSESIAKATCDALVKYIDLLIANNFQKIGIRTVLQVDHVSYCAGSNGTKLPPIYMKSLDNELIPVLHRITSSNLGENAIILELIFRILNV